MAKKVPNLRLVSELERSLPGTEAGVGNAFRVASLGELTTAEQNRVKRIVSEICPKAGIIGVATTPRSWDLRAVVLKPGESNPSIIRFLGPEVTLSLSISTRVSDLFKRMASYRDLSARMFETGVFEGQIWYRREYLDKTLGDLLRESDQISLTSAAVIAKNLLQEIENWHARGIAHGHIVPANICLAQRGDITLLDPGMGIAVVQATQALELEQFPKGYHPKTFAAESLAGEAVHYSADTYGLGLVFNELFIRVADVEDTSERVNRLLELSQLMVSDDPSSRPELSKIKTFIGAAINAKAHVVETEVTSTAEQQKPKRGRIVSTRSTSAASLSGEAKRVEKGIEKPVEKQPVAPSPAQPEKPVMQARPQAPVPPVQHAPHHAVVAPIPADSSAHAPQPPHYHSEYSHPSYPPQTAQEHPAPQHAHPRPNYAGLGPEGPQAIDNFRPEDLEAKPRAGARSVPYAEANNKRSLTPVYVAFAVIALACALYYRSTRPEPEEVIRRDELRLLWESGQPSRMKLVAEVAVNGGEEGQLAEMLIINAALRGTEVPSGVNVEMLRIAFDKRWEAELNEADRRSALALALGTLLADKMPTDLPSLSSLHPGVVLALSATSGPNAAKFLNDVPAQKFTNLPPPFAPAFQQLLEETKTATAGDEPVRVLARAGTRGVQPGIDASEELVKFIGQNVTLRLRALALLFSEDEQQARRLLDLLLNHPNLKLDHALFVWGEEQELMSWETISASEQLLILAGIPPVSEVRQSNIAQMFVHPAAEIRSYAIRQALDRIKWAHPGAYSVLSQLKVNPELLTPNQTLLLGRILDKPAKISEKEIRNWLAGKPPVPIVTTLLLATAAEREATTLDFELARYLYGQNWDPSLTELGKLITHPDRYTRFLAYSRIFNLRDHATAKTLLSEALSQEKDEKYREQLTDMLELLSSSSR